MEALQNLTLVIVAILLVLLNAFFVAAEFAMVKLRATRLDGLRRKHGLAGKVLATVHGHLDSYLSACQLGITLASLGLGWIGEPAFAHLLEAPLRLVGIESPDTVETIAFVTAFALISFLHIVLGELAPKSLALRKTEFLSLTTALPLYAFYWVMFPAIWVLNVSANWILRKAGLEDPAADVHYSHEELRAILHFGRATQDDRPQSEVTILMAHALELSDLVVGDLMRARREMVTLSTDLSHAELRLAVQAHRYSRYPLVEAQTREIAGIVHVKDVLLEPLGEDLAQRLRALARPAVTTISGLPALDLLRQFRHGTSHFALVYDEQGALEGFITLEDILETVFGEIHDEYEKGRAEQVDRGPVKLKDGSLMVRGETPIFMLERALGHPIVEAGHLSTVSGLVMERLEQLPSVGAVAEFSGFTVTVRRVDGVRLVAAKVTPRSAAEGEGERPPPAD